MGSQNGSNSRQVDGDLESQRLASARRGDGFEPLSVEAVTFQAPKISRRGRTYVIFLAVVAVSSITAAALVLTLHFGWASEAGSAGTIVPDPFLLTDWQRRPRSVTARGGAVAADAGACSAAGALVLEEGGSAVDAAVAATFCQGVVNPMASGIGGGCFLLIRRDTRLSALNTSRTTIILRTSPAQPNEHPPTRSMVTSMPRSALAQRARRACGGDCGARGRTSLCPQAYVQRGSRVTEAGGCVSGSTSGGQGTSSGLGAARQARLEPSPGACRQVRPCACNIALAVTCNPRRVRSCVAMSTS